MNHTNLEAVLEAVLFASGDVLEPQKLSSALLVSEEEIREAMEVLTERYASAEHGIQILNLNGKYQMCSKSLYIEQIRTVLSLKNNTPLSNAAFEVLAIVAYNQPVTKSFIEQIRGVDCSGVISTLCQRNLIEEHGRLDLPGRPLLYCTTTNFLRCFSMSSLDELPQLPKNGELPEEKKTSAPGEMEGQLSIL